MNDKNKVASEVFMYPTECRHYMFFLMTQSVVFSSVAAQDRQCSLNKQLFSIFNLLFNVLP